MFDPVVLKRFDKPDECREFPMGKFEIVHLGGMEIGRATYAPGWRWSNDVGAAMGSSSCEVEHVGMVLSGCATAAMDDGSCSVAMRRRSSASSAPCSVSPFG